jgi:hypothetical protein
MRARTTRRTLLPVLIAALVGGLMGVGAPAASAGQQTVYIVEMSGDQVVSGPGDPDGTGTAVLTLDKAAGTVCASIHTENVTEADPFNPRFGIVLHDIGPVPLPGSPGAAVAVLSAAYTPDPDFEGCTALSAEAIKQIQKYPDRFFVQVNTELYDEGAIRGQLVEAPRG